MIHPRWSLPLVAIAAFALVSTSPLRADTLVIPGAAHASGVGGTVWRTDVWLLNANADPADVSWIARASDSSACGSASPATTIRVEPGATVRIDDPMNGVAAAGLLEIEAPTGVIARARTYAVVAAGTYGQSLPVLATSSFLDAGSTAVLPGAIRNARFRTNLLVQSGPVLCSGDSSFVATVTLRGRDGSIAGTGSVRVPARGLAFVLDPFGGWGGGDCDGCRIDVTAPAPFSCLSSVVDNATGDPTSITPDN